MGQLEAKITTKLSHPKPRADENELLMSGANVTIRGLNVSTFVTVKSRWKVCRAAEWRVQTLIYSYVNIEKILVV